MTWSFYDALHAAQLRQIAREARDADELADRDDDLGDELAARESRGQD